MYYVHLYSYKLLLAVLRVIDAIQLLVISLLSCVLVTLGILLIALPLLYICMVEDPITTKTVLEEIDNIGVDTSEMTVFHKLMADMAFNIPKKLLNLFFKGF